MAQEEQRRRIAVVGGGVSGIVSAHQLSSQHSVDLFEAGSWLGGHTHTVKIETGVDCGAAILVRGDTLAGFGPGDVVRFTVADEGTAYLVPTR